MLLEYMLDTLLTLWMLFKAGGRCHGPYHCSFLRSQKHNSSPVLDNIRQLSYTLLFALNFFTIRSRNSASVSRRFPRRFSLPPAAAAAAAAAAALFAGAGKEPG
eukprot:GHUV01026169.1.p1 GENE.GHUV01026169.1~~GHUV01026169.1.p1  ORF type:complete len:104 (-),score=29.74 GHUV01026169.1:1-312(-)